jgi:hypothetical protein
MPRLPNTISLIRRGRTPRSRASRFWLMLIRLRNSSLHNQPIVKNGYFKPVLYRSNWQADWEGGGFQNLSNYE